MSCVYRHTFPNGGVYIGKTDMTPEDRWLNGWGYKNCPLMFAAILQYGWDNIKHEILADNLTKEEALNLEIEEIHKHSVSAPMIYNLAQLPPQYLAQENSHFLSVKHKVTTTKSDTNHSHYKHHIIPLVEKPIGLRHCGVDVYLASTGELIATYPNAKIASSELGINHGDIISCCKGVKSNGKARFQVKGYVFRYTLNSKERE